MPGDLKGIVAAALHVRRDEAFAVALSGGPDSTALLHLALDGRRSNDATLTALIVDHGLRSDSAAEARLTAERAEAAGATAIILTWKGDKPVTGRQAAARDARYGLMLDWCRANHVQTLLLGHHLDDQAATVLMRLRHGSGPVGLGGMAPDSTRDGIRLLRPLLDVRKAALLDWLHARTIPYIEDPTNRAPRYERNRLNDFLNDEDTEDSLTVRLGRLAARNRRWDAALDAATVRAWEQCCSEATDDRVVFRKPDWQALSEEIRLRLVVRAIMQLTGERPSLGKVEDALASLRTRARLTVGGALLARNTRYLTVTREPPRRA